jgi:hypothetical protein
MAQPTQSIIDTRRHQMFPTLQAAEVERLRRFGSVRPYGAGDALATVGGVSEGLTIVLGGLEGIRNAFCDAFDGRSPPSKSFLSTIHCYIQFQSFALLLNRPVSSDGFSGFPVCMRGFAAQSLFVIFQFPFRAAEDQFDN